MQGFWIGVFDDDRALWASGPGATPTPGMMRYLKRLLREFLREPPVPPSPSAPPAPPLRPRPLRRRRYRF